MQAARCCCWFAETNACLRVVTDDSCNMKTSEERYTNVIRFCQVVKWQKLVAGCNTLVNIIHTVVSKRLFILLNIDKFYFLFYLSIRKEANAQ